MKEKISTFLNKFYKSYIWIGLLFLVVDIISKNLICNLMEEGDSIVLIPKFLSITYTINRHAAFGIGSNNLALNKALYITFAVIATIVICFYFKKNYNDLKGYTKAALMMILAGAIGNMIDRIFYSPEYLHAFDDNPGVVDFIDFFNGSKLYNLWHYIFNVADCGVVIGVFILLISMIIEEVKEFKKDSKEKSNDKVLSASEKKKIEEEKNDSIK